MKGRIQFNLVKFSLLEFVLGPSNGLDQALTSYLQETPLWQFLGPLNTSTPHNFFYQGLIYPLQHPADTAKIVVTLLQPSSS